MVPVTNGDQDGAPGSGLVSLWRLREHRAQAKAQRQLSTGGKQVALCVCVCVFVHVCTRVWVFGGKVCTGHGRAVLNVRVGTELCLKGTEPSMGWKEGRAGSAHTAQLSLEKIHTEPDGTTSLPSCPGLLLPSHSSAL